MPSLRALVACGFALIAGTQAYGIPSAGERHFRFVVRQAQDAPTSTTECPSAATSAVATNTSSSSAQAVAAADVQGAIVLTDVDILQFALTAEHLESTFYAQGFQKFSDADFTSAGLQAEQITELRQIGTTESAHVSALMSAIAAAGQQPVEACTYNFPFTDAAGMLSTARVLEAVGVSAYLGAAPLINSSAVLSTAASIVTVEARHQTFIRVATGAEAVPAPFDTPLGVRAAFTLVSQFVASCPAGSALALQPNPQIALEAPGGAVLGGQTLALQSPAAQPAGAMFCAYVGPGGAQFAPLAGGRCDVPANMVGEVYMLVTRSQSVADTEILAGPSVIQMS